MEYARNFMEYLNQKRNIPFEVHAFSSAEMFLEFAKNNETEILLISDKAMKEEIRRYPIRQIIILSEGVHSPVLDQYPAVYKYQSSEKVIREVMACYGVENGVDTIACTAAEKGNAHHRHLFAGRTDAEDLVCPDDGADSGQRAGSAVSQYGELFRI